MTTTATPFGMRPVQHMTGSIRPRVANGLIASGYASSIYKYGPVTMQTTGLLAAATTAQDFIGALAGVEYTDPNGYYRISKYWPANTTYQAGSCTVAFWDDPSLIYEMQANGSITQTAIGDQSDFVNPGAGSTVTGESTAALNSTLAGAGVQGQLRILGLVPLDGNAWGDAYTMVTVQIARHQYVTSKVAI